MSKNIDEWHQTFTEKLERKLWLMRQIAREKEIIGRLERAIGAREIEGISYKYEELRMEFSNEELKMLIDCKIHRLYELQEELEGYRKRQAEAKKKMEKINEALSKKYECIKDNDYCIPAGTICDVMIHNDTPYIFYNGIRICEVGSIMQKLNFREVLK